MLTWLIFVIICHDYLLSESERQQFRFIENCYFAIQPFFSAKQLGMCLSGRSAISRNVASRCRRNSAGVMPMRRLNSPVKEAMLSNPTLKHASFTDAPDSRSRSALSIRTDVRY